MSDETIYRLAHMLAQNERQIRRLKASHSISDDCQHAETGADTNVDGHYWRFCLDCGVDLPAPTVAS